MVFPSCKTNTISLCFHRFINGESGLNRFVDGANKRFVDFKSVTCYVWKFLQTEKYLHEHSWRFGGVECLKSFVKRLHQFSFVWLSLAFGTAGGDPFVEWCFQKQWATQVVEFQHWSVFNKFVNLFCHTIETLFIHRFKETKTASQLFCQLDSGPGAAIWRNH